MRRRTRIEWQVRSFRPAMVRLAGVSRLYWRTMCSLFFSNICNTRNPSQNRQRILEIDFRNVCYAEGVQNLDGMRLKMLLHAENYLIGQLLGYEFEIRVEILSHIEFACFEPICPLISKPHHPSQFLPASR